MNASEASDVIERLDSQATRIETRCGPSANMVWRRWGEGRPVVLLHGGAGSWMHWIRNIEPLAKTRAVWAPDIPGFGDSDLPSDELDADTLAPYVLQGALGVLRGARFDLVGFSFGGLVAGCIAAETPATLERLVLVSVAGMGLDLGRPVFKPLRGLTDPREMDDVRRFNLGALMLHHPASIDDLALAVQETSASRDRVKNRKLIFTDILLRLAQQWRCAAYGIWGRQDVLYREQFDQLTDRVDALNLRERVFLDAAGHWLQYERCEEFNCLLARFLDAPLTTHHSEQQR
jgi:2-hydroxy-6-oxonona-2,4-dienedioate hydrolase